MCRSLISTPALTAEIAASDPVAKAVERSEPDELLLDKIAVAKQMTPEELEAREARHREKRKVFNAPGDRAESVDWETSEAKGKEKGLSLYLVGGVAMAAVLMAALGIYYIQNAPQGDRSNSKRVVGDAAANAALQESLEIPTTTGNVDDQAIVESVNAFEKFDLIAIEKSVRTFLESDSVEERVKWVREPERVKPLMEKYYAGGKIEPEGFDSLNRTNISYRGRFLTTLVRTGDYLGYHIAIVREGEGEDARYLVDWESWAGYSEYSPEEARERKPTEPFLMRVVLRRENYFNFDFSDDKMWNGYRMGFRISDESFLAYTAKGSPADKLLDRLRQDAGSSPYTVRVRYPENARMDDQVEIVEVVSAGWIDAGTSMQNEE